MQFYTMTTAVRQIWKGWQQRRRQRKVSALLLQREEIKRRGMSIYAEVEEGYSTGISAEGMNLMRVRLKIRLFDDQCLHSLSYAFVPPHWKGLNGGMPIKAQFLAGDLSQVIIRI